MRASCRMILRVGAWCVGWQGGAGCRESVGREELGGEGVVLGEMVDVDGWIGGGVGEAE